MKRVGKYLLSIILFFIIVLIGGGIFIYIEGPNYALQKIKFLAKEKYQIDLEFKSASVESLNKITVNDIIVKNENLNLSIHKLIIQYHWNWNLKKLTIENILIDQPQFKLLIALDTPPPPKNETSKSNDQLKFLEDLINEPLQNLDVQRISINQLSGQFRSESLFASQKVEIILGKTDFNLNLALIKKKLKLNFELKVNGITNFLYSDQFKSLKTTIKSFNFLSQIDIYKENYWTSNVDLSTLSFEFEKFLYKSNFQKITELEYISFANLKSSMQLQSNFLSQSLGLLEDLKPQSVKWNLELKVEGQNGAYAKNGNLNFHSKGVLTNAQPSLKTLQLPFDWETEFNFQGGPFYYENQNTKISLTAKIKNLTSIFNLQTLNNNLLNFLVKSELHKNTTQLKGVLKSSIPKIGGLINIPFTLILTPEKKLNHYLLQWSSIVSLQNINYKNDKFQIKNLNGEFPITEKIYINLNDLSFNSLRFSQLTVQNPFERVDYQRADPFVRLAKPIRIERLFWFDKDIGSFKGIINLNQNLLSIHSFDFDLYSGSVTGEIFIDLNHDNKRFGFLGRFTHLDLATLLPSKFIKSNTQALPLSGRAGLVFSLNRRTLDGRLDISKIGGPQVITLINVLDPNYLDVKFNKIRMWLEKGYPNSILMLFHDGNLDLDLSISAFNLTKQQSVEGISIQSFIDKAIDK